MDKELEVKNSSIDVYQLQANMMRELKLITNVIFIVLMILGILASAKIVLNPECYISCDDPCAKCIEAGFYCSDPNSIRYNSNLTNYLGTNIIKNET